MRSYVRSCVAKNVAISAIAPWQEMLVENDSHSIQETALPTLNSSTERVVMNPMVVAVWLPDQINPAMRWVLHPILRAIAVRTLVC